MAGPPEVLLLDDGELDDVQEILDSLETPYGRIRGGAVSEHTSPPGRLLVTTPRHAAAVDLTGTKDERYLVFQSTCLHLLVPVLIGCNASK